MAGAHAYMNYVVYILQSRKNGLRYIGYTRDRAKRLREHNTGRNIATEGKGPWKLVYSEDYPSLLFAKKREKFFKTGRGRAVLKNIVGA